MKTLVLGLGNSILTDDAAGLRVIDELKNLLLNPDVTVDRTEAGGINLLEYLEGYDRAIIVDSVQLPAGKPGQIYCLQPGDLPATRYTGLTHGIDFPTILELGKMLGMKMPAEIWIFAIQAQDVLTIGEKCTPAVAEAIRLCTRNIVCLLNAGSGLESCMSG